MEDDTKDLITIEELEKKVAPDGGIVHSDDWWPRKRS